MLKNVCHKWKNNVQHALHHMGTVRALDKATARKLGRETTQESEGEPEPDRLHILTDDTELEECAMTIAKDLRTAEDDAEVNAMLRKSIQVLSHQMAARALEAGLVPVLGPQETSDDGKKSSLLTVPYFELGPPSSERPPSAAMLRNSSNVHLASSETARKSIADATSEVHAAARKSKLPNPTELSQAKASVLVKRALIEHRMHQASVRPLAHNAKVAEMRGRFGGPDPFLLREEEDKIRSSAFVQEALEQEAKLHRELHSGKKAQKAGPSWSGEPFSVSMENLVRDVNDIEMELEGGGANRAAPNVENPASSTVESLQGLLLGENLGSSGNDHFYGKMNQIKKKHGAEMKAAKGKRAPEEGEKSANNLPPTVTVAAEGEDQAAFAADDGAKSDQEGSVALALSPRSNASHAF
ncbi:unnamed protein product [Amoebophrya sp. A25]|nr:unnamed protein product [Amoebophrya sp. A25]|eukprot:GSA25T00003192001.1